MTKINLVKVGNEYNMNNKNLQAAIESLKVAQKGCRERLIDVDDLRDLTTRAVDYLKCLGVPNKHLEGIKIRINRHSQSFPASYNGHPESTQFNIEFTKAGVPFISLIGRGAATTEKFRYELNEVVKKDIIGHIESGKGML